DRYRVARMRELNTALTESRTLTEQLTSQRAVLSKANRTLALEASVTGIISDSESLADAASRILQGACEVTHCHSAELREVDAPKRALRSVAIWNKDSVVGEPAKPDKDSTAQGFRSADPLPGDDDSRNDAQGLSEPVRQPSDTDVANKSFG